MKLISILSLTVLFILSSCGSEPTFDGSSEEAAESSLMDMFSSVDFGENGKPSEDEMTNLPPGLETYMCAGVQAAFSSFGQDPAAAMASVNETFNGMTASEMAAYGEENDLIGCMTKMMEGLKKLGN